MRYAELKSITYYEGRVIIQEIDETDAKTEKN